MTIQPEENDAAIEARVLEAMALGQTVIIRCKGEVVAIMQPPEYRVERLTARR